jgi:TatD DNase family protein
MDSLRLVLDKGFMVSFAGIITFKNNPLAEAVAYAPLDRILIETDAPYLAPVPHRGLQNQPAWVSLVGGRLAEIKGLGADAVAGATAANFQKVFRRQPSSAAPPAPGN